MTIASGFVDMSDVIDMETTGSYLVTRPGPASFVDGVKVASAPTTFIITGSVQPWSGRDFERLPDGFRDMEKLLLWTRTELRTAGPSIEPDLVTVNGLQHQVGLLKRWNELGNFFVVALVRPAS